MTDLAAIEEKRFKMRNAWRAVLLNVRTDTPLVTCVVWLAVNATTCCIADVTLVATDLIYPFHLLRQAASSKDDFISLHAL